MSDARDNSGASGARHPVIITSATQMGVSRCMLIAVSAVSVPGRVRCMLPSRPEVLSFMHIRRTLILLVAIAALGMPLSAQWAVTEKLDLDATYKIKDEGLQRSK